MARPPLPLGAVLVVGLARSGVAAAQALAARGYEVTAVDSGDPGPLDLHGLATATNTDGLAQLEHARWVVKSPGVPREAPVIAAALGRGLQVMGELELGWRLLENEFIAVTGTNGKTTTTELIGHVLRTAGLPVRVAGNVGTALTSLAGEDLEPATMIVCECSSFQLEDALEFAPEAAVLLNLEPDHLDRHGTFERYSEAKLRIFARQGNDDIAVAPAGLAVRDLGGCARCISFGEGPGAEMALRSGQLFWGEDPLMRADELSLRGAHNASNALAAAAVCLARGIESDAVAHGLRTFPGVEHRLEQLATRDGVDYVNDSKATNVASTLVALQAYADREVLLILGGIGKDQDFAPLRGPTGRCREVLLIGRDGPLIGAAIGRGEDCGTLERAIERAADLARPGDVVLLSPACASFDQFQDFEARGKAFKKLLRSSS